MFLKYCHCQITIYFFNKNFRLCVKLLFFFFFFTTPEFFNRSFLAQMFLGFWNLEPTFQIRSDGWSDTSKTTLSTEFVLVSQDWGCCHKGLGAGRLEAAEIDSLTMPEAGSLKSRCRQGLAPSETCRGSFFASSQLLAVCGQPLVFLGLLLCHSSLSLCGHMVFT